jgi:general secretion pathway protein I
VKHSRGFTLLEVLMAVAILGLGLSVLLGAQTGLFASASRAEHISVATGLARCRVSELELELLQKGFPLIDQESDGDCCMGEPSDGFDCSWKVQRVELPDPSEMNPAGDGGLDLSTDALSSGALGAGSNPMSALLSLEQGSGSALGEKPDLGALATELTGSMGGTDAIAGIVMGFVYPTLKPMLEASIRKVIVSVRWREGSRERTLGVTYYVTDPKQAAAASEEAEGALQGIENSMPMNTPAPTSTATSGAPR